jgi:hypothetical protein
MPIYNIRTKRYGDLPPYLTYGFTDTLNTYTKIPLGADILKQRRHVCASSFFPYVLRILDAEWSCGETGATAFSEKTKKLEYE